MKLDRETFNTWIRQHKLFALSAPVVVLLTIYFLVNSLGSFGQGTKPLTGDEGYNNNLPEQENELEVQSPNELYKKSQQDSLERSRSTGTLKNIVDARRKNDSLELILEELNAFSFDDSPSTSSTEIIPPSEQESITSKTELLEKLEYRKMILEARDERLSRSQDYSAPYVESSNKPVVSSISIDAAIYRDQFILPGNRVTLILREDVRYNGRLLPKNTFVFAKSNLQGSRVLLEVTNIDNVKIPLQAIDQEDGMVGLHNERAGELLSEFTADIQGQGINELSEAVGEFSDTPIGRNLVRSFGNFFQRKNIGNMTKFYWSMATVFFWCPKNKRMAKKLFFISMLIFCFHSQGTTMQRYFGSCPELQDHFDISRKHC